MITGASSGLGEATARRLVAEGAKLAIGARRLNRLQALAAELRLPSEAVVQTDVTKREEVKRLVDRAVDTYGRIDVILNNAGLMPHSPLERGKVDDWEGFYKAIAIPADSFARMVAFAMSQPDEVDVNEILFRPTRQEG